MIYADLNDAIAGNLLYNDENKLLYSDRVVTNNCTISVSFPDWDLDICGYVVGHSEDNNCLGWSWKSETENLPEGLHARWLSGDKTQGGTEYVLIDVDKRQPSDFSFTVACNWYTNPAPHDVTIVAEDIWGNRVEKTITPTSDRQHTRAERNDPSATFNLTRTGYLKKVQ